jgi:methionyl-tRNA formyltransferase
MTPKPLVFFGSSIHFSAQVLQKLIDSSSNLYSLVSVVTTPDVPVGRHLQLTPNPVKVLAQQHNIPVFTDIREFLKSFPSPEIRRGARGEVVGLVSAYGRLIGPKTLAAFNGHIYGIHPSLLPKYRGPSPLQQQILDGITDTGVTLYQLDTGQDTGPIVSQTHDIINPNDTQISLGERLFHLGTSLFIERVGSTEGIESIIPTPQNSSLATTTHLLTRQDGFVPWEEISKYLPNQNWPTAISQKLRAFYPWPGVWTIDPNGNRIKYQPKD